MAQLTFTTQQKAEISQLVAASYGNGKTYKDGATFGRSAGVGSSQMTWIKDESKWHNLGVDMWLKFARAVNYMPNETPWNTAQTAVYIHITGQLALCQKNAYTGILCDDAGIGKTHTAKDYIANNENAFYIDCSQYSGKAAFIRALARSVGVDAVGKLVDVEAAAIYALNYYENPLIIFDEAGDLDGASILVLKRLYNSLEGKVGMYLMGADGLRSKIQRGIQYNKLGFVEVFSRFGKKFQKGMQLKDTTQATKVAFLQAMAEDIALANGIASDADLKTVVASITKDGSINDMRRVKLEVKKILNKRK